MKTRGQVVFRFSIYRSHAVGSQQKREEGIMGLRTVEQYKASLRDGRLVYFRGKRVEDVTSHPVIGTAVNHAAIDCEIAHQLEHRDLAVAVDFATGEEYSRYFKIPANAEDLLKRS